MDFNTSKSDLNLYLLREVVVSFTDGRSIHGRFKNISPTSQEITIDDMVYPVKDVRDVEMVGNVTYHTYATEKKKSYDIDGSIFFGLDDFVDNTDYSQIRYGEFKCLVACHLFISESKLSAKDVRIISLSHYSYAPALEKKRYLYMMRDGSSVVGILKGNEHTSICKTICKSDGSEYSINFDDVQDIIRLPLFNDRVEITLRDKSSVCGTVSTVDDSKIIVVIDKTLQTVQVVQMHNILSIRYTGIVAINDRTWKTTTGDTIWMIKLSLSAEGELFRCKLPFFRTPGDRTKAEEGVQASFVPGITEDGLIAKDVTVEAEQPAHINEITEVGIIVTAPTNEGGLGYWSPGYIGKEYVTKPYKDVTNTKTDMPRGSVQFEVDQLSEPINSRKIYVVEYVCDHKSDRPMAQRVKVIKPFPKSESAKIWIDGFGDVHWLAISALFSKNFINQMVDVETNDEKLYSGTLAESLDFGVTLDTKTGKVSIKAEDIRRIFYYGNITFYLPNNGTGYINGLYWFHVNDFSDFIQSSQLQTGVSVRFSFEVTEKGKFYAVKSISIAKSNLPQKTGFDRTDHHLVTYNEQVHHEERGASKSACNIQILEQHLKPSRNKQCANTDTESNMVISPSDNIDQATLLKVVSLSDDIDQTSLLAGVDYEYGLINVFYSHWACINSLYYNKNYIPNANYDLSQTTFFNPEEATIIPSPCLKTGKYTYLIRYVRNGVKINPKTGVAQPTVDYSHPIEVVKGFLKRQCKSIVLDGNNIKAECLDEDNVIVDCSDMFATNQDRIPNSSDNYDDAPDLMHDESVYIYLKDGNTRMGVYSGEDEEELIINESTKVSKKTIAWICRFGVITALKMDRGTATINNIFDFSLNVAEPKIVNILETQRALIRFPVMYYCVNGKITKVCRITSECLERLAWECGRVAECDGKSHKMIINDLDTNTSPVHYLTVMSVHINPFVKNGGILNQDVYVKQVFHPFLQESELHPGIVPMAVDVRCREEDLRIQYDDGKDTFLGYRDATFSFPVLGPRDYLSKNKGETLRVIFEIASDQASLEGHVAEDPEVLSGLLAKAERLMREIIKTEMRNAFSDKWRHIINQFAKNKEHYLESLRKAAALNGVPVSSLTKLDIMSFDNYYEVVSRYWELFSRYFAKRYPNKNDLRSDMYFLAHSRNHSAHFTLYVYNGGKRQKLRETCERLINCLENPSEHTEPEPKPAEFQTVNKSVKPSPTVVRIRNGIVPPTDSQIQEIVDKQITFCCQARKPKGLRGIIKEYGFPAGISQNKLAAFRFKFPPQVGDEIKAVVDRWDFNGQLFNLRAPASANNENRESWNH